MTYTIAAFYRFVRISEPAVLRHELLSTFADSDLLGTTRNHRIKQSLGAITAARFLQVENQLLMLLDLQVEASLPVVK